MSGQRAHPALDGFRWVAALLVVAIHTSPLAGVNEVADFLLTRVLGRVAVPFFFMTTGCFMAAHLNDGAWLRRQLYRLAAMYGAAVVAYLPLNAYAGALNRPGFGAWLRALLLDGTFYHLWYLPAVMLGLCITWALLRAGGMKAALAVSGALYALGLLGDSYYGLIAGTPLDGLYALLFRCFAQTRNGLFFAPVFLVLGAALGRRRPDARTAAVGLALSLAGMSAEALLLRRMGWMRHDSMYVCLIPAMICLFSLLLACNAAQRPRWRTRTMLVYLLHPWVIVLVRGVAKCLGREALFIENAGVHFLAVAALSITLALLLERMAAEIGSARRKAAHGLSEVQKEI